MRLAALLLASLAVACSSSDGDGAAAATIPAAFSKYCTGTLKASFDLMQPAGSGAWMGNGAFTAGPGTPFLIEADSFDDIEGYVIDGAGRPSKIAADFQTGLVKDKDFSTDCDLTNAKDRSVFVLLSRATLYANADLTGASCALDAATEFTSYGFSSGGEGAAKFQSSDLQAKCGFSEGYSRDLLYAKLVAK